MSSDCLISRFVHERGIESVLHFTTNRGALGILASHALKSRRRLNDDEHLAHIFQPNAAYRTKDAHWLDYVNLSISKINYKFFQVSANSWHASKDFWWAIFDFSPSILAHEGVVFSTTNNIYTGVLRGPGAEGLAALYVDKVSHWNGVSVERSPATPLNEPTCFQAEVLYPGEVATTFLQRIYVPSPDAADELIGQFYAVSHPLVEVIVAPELLEGM